MCDSQTSSQCKVSKSILCHQQGSSSDQICCCSVWRAGNSELSCVQSAKKIYTMWRKFCFKKPTCRNRINTQISQISCSVTAFSCFLVNELLLPMKATGFWSETLNTLAEISCWERVPGLSSSTQSWVKITGPCQTVLSHSFTSSLSLCDRKRYKPTNSHTAVGVWDSSLITFCCLGNEDWKWGNGKDPKESFNLML